MAETTPRPRVTLAAPAEERVLPLREPDAFASYARAFSWAFSRVRALDPPTRVCATSSKPQTRVSEFARVAADATHGMMMPMIVTSHARKTERRSVRGRRGPP